MPVLIDTSAVVAALDRSDPAHDRVVAALGAERDAALVALAERLGVIRVYTLDRRDFAMVRPSLVEAFEVLPSEA